MAYLAYQELLQAVDVSAVGPGTYVPVEIARIASKTVFVPSAGEREKPLGGSEWKQQGEVALRQDRLSQCAWRRGGIQARAEVTFVSSLVPTFSGLGQ